MSRYLDPRVDLVFKKIFGEHPDLLISFLNALIPLPKGKEISRIDYLPAELVPNTPLGKDSIVDVRCVDNFGRQFIVEMQMLWTSSFRSRMVFNSSKAYVKQLTVGKPYDLLEPVYGIGIVNAKIFPEKEQFYHHYKVINVEDSEDIIEDLEFILVELEKDIKLKGLTKLQHKQLAVLWLRFLKETKGDRTIEASELSQHAELQKAVSICEVGGYTDAELFLYERNSDAISTEKTLQNETRREALEEGEAKGLAKGKVEGRIEGRAEGEKKKETEFILKMWHKLQSIEEIHALTDIPLATIEEILTQNGINT